MVKISNVSELSMDLGSGVEGLLNQILDTRTKDFKRDLDFSGDSFVNVDDKIFENGEKEGLGKVKEDFRSLDIVSEARNVESGNENEVISESSVVKEEESSKKRKRKCYSHMIKWILQVAKDPYDPVIGEIPESKRWKNYGIEHLWKQVLLVRETMLLKRDLISSAQRSNWQNKQMQPAMYEDRIVRPRRKVVSVKESHNKSSIKDNVEVKKSDLITIDSSSSKCVPLGPRFQADIPDWDGEFHGSDSKWLGNKIWPLEMHEQNKFLIERERIGKGSQDSCGCKSRGSFECVRFHIAEKRTRMKLELGPSFSRWKFDNMGEDVSLTWNKEEEMNFNNIVKSNGKCFWNQLIEAFPIKGRESLVKYYFNVYLLHRRAYQNRTNTCNIDTDDEEELGSQVVKPRGSIFCSPKKVRPNFR